MDWVGIFRKRNKKFTSNFRRTTSWATENEEQHMLEQHVVEITVEWESLRITSNGRILLKSSEFMSNGSLLINSSKIYPTEFASYFIRWKTITPNYVRWKRPFINNNEQLSSIRRQLLNSCI
jgi:hypothetical protein